MKNQTKTEPESEREFVVSRTINGGVRPVFEAWTKSEKFREWWVPESAPMKLVSCEMEVRTGGTYRLVFNIGPNNMEFFGRYPEVVPHSRLVWTNDESGADAAAITTVTFEETDGTTVLTVRDLYPSKEALDEAIASGATGGLPVQLEQLNQFIINQKNL